MRLLLIAILLVFNSVLVGGSPSARLQENRGQDPPQNETAVQGPSPQQSPDQEPQDEEGQQQAPQEEEGVSEEPQSDEATVPPVGPPVVERSESSGGLGFRFNNVPIGTVIDTVMQELGYSYVIDPQVQGTVSIYTMEEIPKEKAFEVLQQLLQMNGHGIVEQEGLYVIVPLGQTTKVPHELIVRPETPSESQPGPTDPPSEPPSPGSAAPGPLSATQPAQQAVPASQTVVSVLSAQQEQEEQELEGVITYVIPLHHIPSSEMVTMMTPFVSNGANVINYVSANIIIITDYWSNIEQVLKLVNLLDTRYFDVNTVDLIPIRYNQALDVATDLAQVFAPGDTPAGVRIVAIERLNSILVVTRSSAVFQEVKKWVDKLDAPTAGTNVKTFVYQVENNTAMNIAEVLAQLYQDGLGLPSSPSSAQDQEGRPQQPFAQRREPGFVSPQQGGGGAFGGGGQQLGPSLAGRPMSTQSGILAVVSGNVKIIVNEFNNSLIIQATEADYQFLLQTVKQLDVLPRQVLIEAKIYSVELRDDLSFGVAAFLQERGSSVDPNDPNNTIDTGGPATTGQISPEGALSLTTRAFIGTDRELLATVNALRTKTNVEIVEAPRLLALDGMQAQINVGAEVPVTTASFGDPLRAGNANSFVNSIQFRPTGVTMLIMPRISASGIVTMDLAIEVSSATGAALTPTINRNFITTSLLVRDGQTVAIAGIISDSADVSRSRVPVLGDIPILGALFGQTNRNQRRSELIFFITPRVIRNLPTATELTLDFKRALRNAYDFIEGKESAEEELIRNRREEELRNQ